MPKILNMVFEVSLTKGGIRTSSCLYVVSSKWSHSNVTNYASMHKELHFVHFVAKSIKHHSRRGHSSRNDFDVGGPFRKLKGAQDYHFQQWTHAISLGVQLISTLQHMFPCTHLTPFFAIWRGGGTSQNITSKDVQKTSSWASSKTSALPPCLVDLRFEITIDENKSKNFNHKTMQIKLQNLSNPNIAKNNWEKKIHLLFFIFDNLIQWNINNLIQCLNPN